MTLFNQIDLFHPIAWLAADLPETVREFIHLFDTGRYGDLLEHTSE